MWIKTPNGNLFTPENGVTICLVNMYNPKIRAVLDVNGVTVEYFENEKEALKYLDKLAGKLGAEEI